MHIHRVAMLALLTAAVVTGCDSARDLNDASAQANAWGCDQCHGYPPPPNFPWSNRPENLQPFAHAQVTGAMCTVCHPATVLADGHTINATPITDDKGNTHIAHRDGQVEIAYGPGLPLEGSCDACHGLPPATGKHLFHTQRGIACSTCHDGFDTAAKTQNDAVHMTGLDYIVVQGGTHIAKQKDQNGDWPTAECDECHAVLAK